MFRDTTARIVDLRSSEGERGPISESEPCFYGAEPVTIHPAGAVTTCTPDGYDGLDAEGRPVCAECWCPTCGYGHATAEERATCERYVEDDTACPHSVPAPRVPTLAEFCSKWSTPLWERGPVAIDPHDPEANGADPDWLYDARTDR